MVEARFIENRDTQILFCAIRFRHLKESIYFSNCRNIVWNKWLDFRVQLDLLWFIPLNVLEHFFEILTDIEICILTRIICSRDLFFFIFVLLFLLCLTLRHHLLVLQLLLLLLFRGLRLYIDINVHLVLFFFRINLF